MPASVIDAFGTFVIGGNYAVGIILFLILIGINFIVITKGAGRVAEVAARFTLDSMPGKQMAIDAELSGGFIDEDEARRRREGVPRGRLLRRHGRLVQVREGRRHRRGSSSPPSTWSAGSSSASSSWGCRAGCPRPRTPCSPSATGWSPRYLRWSFQHRRRPHGHQDHRRAEGPAPRSSASSPRSLARLWIAAGFLALLGAVPGFPLLPFWILAGVTAFSARRLNQAQDRHDAAALAAQVELARPVADPGSAMGEILQVNTLELDIGYALIPLADEKQGGDLPDRIRLIRKQIAASTGLLLPEVTIMDDVRLPATEYVFRLRGSEVARGELMPRFLLALDTGGVTTPIDGMEARDPAHGIPGRWISRNRRVEAEAYGYVVVEPTTVIATHLAETLKQYGADLLGRQEVQDMVDTLRRTHPALVGDVVPGKVQLGVLHRVLQRLLREQVPIRDLITILEALGDAADQKVADPRPSRSSPGARCPTSSDDCTATLAAPSAASPSARNWRGSWCACGARALPPPTRRCCATLTHWATCCARCTGCPRSTGQTGAHCRSSCPARSVSACAGSSNRCCPAFRCSRSTSCRRT
jgi:flagellar biosynthesis protein FlhA